MIKAGIIGSTGYAGQELVRLLLGHKDVEIVWYGSRSYIDKKYYDVFRNMFQIVEDVCRDDNLEELAEAVDVIFTATPQGLCASLVSEDILNKVKIIDLSADFRIKDVSVYEKWYGIKHASPEFIPEAVYGLCEINREDIKGARLIANPGCYTTGAPLALAPAVANGLIELTGIIIDSKSGVTGAGRGLSQGTHYPDLNEGLHAYKVASHRHTPEIEQTLSRLSGQKVHVTFVPHLLPVNRGILSTCYGRLKPDVTKAQVRKAYEDFYQDEYFVRLLPDGMNADIHNIKYSNFCDVSLHIDTRCGNLIAISAIDNMVKGAAGQAIQNMNLIFGLEEASGLALVPPAF